MPRNTSSALRISSPAAARSTVTPASAAQPCRRRASRNKHIHVRSLAPPCSSVRAARHTVSASVAHSSDPPPPIERPRALTEARRRAWGVIRKPQRSCRISVDEQRRPDLATPREASGRRAATVRGWLARREGALDIPGSGAGRRDEPRLRFEGERAGPYRIVLSGRSSGCRTQRGHSSFSSMRAAQFSWHRRQCDSSSPPSCMWLPWGNRQRCYH